MKLKLLSATLYASPQLQLDDLPALRKAGFHSIICNRPDGESADQPSFQAIEAEARRLGMQACYLPVRAGAVSGEDGVAFGALLDELPGPIVAYCRSGKRSSMLWEVSPGAVGHASDLPSLAAAPGTAADSLAAPIGASEPAPAAAREHYQIVIVGAGAAGVATAASLLARDATLDIALIDPADVHNYQPGWTMVGAGIFETATTCRPMRSVLPRGVEWIQATVTHFNPERNAVTLAAGREVGYERLVVCPGLSLNWDAIEGLSDTLGRNGVTSNYLGALASYTWQLVQQLRGGRALFTQPPMPIKCAGAPQKAMYLSADYWRQSGLLGDVQIDFCGAGPALFGVPEYVPALMRYVEEYRVGLHFGENLSAIDGECKTATFTRLGADGEKHSIVREFDMIHVVPPQVSPEFIRSSPLADSAGWIDVDQQTLQHKRYTNIFGLGDAANTSNAKTAAAVRKQAPVVAHNLLASLGKLRGRAAYDGYGSCPLTVERGKIVLAEFAYGGKLAPSFPSWLIDGTRPSRLAWMLKARVLPPLYWHGMLKGREWMARPQIDLASEGAGSVG